MQGREENFLWNWREMMNYIPSHDEWVEEFGENRWEMWWRQRGGRKQWREFKKCEKEIRIKSQVSYLKDCHVPHSL